MLKSLNKSIKNIDIAVLSGSNNSGSVQRIDKIKANAKKIVKASSVFAISAIITSMIHGPMTAKNVAGNTLDILSESQSSLINEKNLGNHLGAVSLGINDEYKSNDVIFISQYDKNLKHIISNSNDVIKPDYGNPDLIKFDKWTLNNYLKIKSFLSGDDPVKHFGYIMLNGGERASGQHALSIYEDENNKLSKKFCYIKSFGDNEMEGINGAPIHFSENESKVLIRHHEEAHCLDNGDHVKKFTNPKDDYSEVVLQKEIIADIYASLRSIQITGNLDSIKYTMLPFRMMRKGDKEHQSSFALLKLLEMNLDVDEIKNSSNNDLWDQAKEIVLNDLNFKNNYKDYEKWMKIEDLYSSAHDYADASSKNEYIKYGETLLQTMVNHYIYHDINSKEAVIATLEVARDLYLLKDDKDNLHKVSVFLDEAENNSLSMFSVANNLNINILSSHQNFLSNDQFFKEEHDNLVEKVKEIDKKLKDGSYVRPKYLFDETKKINSSQKIKDKLMEKYKSSNYDSTSIGI